MPDITIDSDVVAQLHTQIADLARQVELLGSTNAAKLGIDLVESSKRAVAIVKFAMARMSPQEIHAWPADDLEQFAQHVRTLPHGDIGQLSDHASWVADAIQFAREARSMDRERTRYEEVFSLDDVPRGLTWLYVAHPVGAPTKVGIEANLARARRWLRWLIDHDTRHAFSLPWLPYCEALDDNVPEHRARGMRDGKLTIQRHDGIVLVGGQLSTGMAGEKGTFRKLGKPCIDLLHLGEEPPDVAVVG